MNKFFLLKTVFVSITNIFVLLIKRLILFWVLPLHRMYQPFPNVPHDVYEHNKIRISVEIKTS